NGSSQGAAAATHRKPARINIIDPSQASSPNRAHQATKAGISSRKPLVINAARPAPGRRSNACTPSGQAANLP
ncbi:MAG: hypothetical protein NWT00_10155, partial [Beijerinckiaceae bacterium]|nr:hypothetical protein [Beijerinckiaceae bacterium]